MHYQFTTTLTFESIFVFPFRRCLKLSLPRPLTGLWCWSENSGKIKLSWRSLWCIPPISRFWKRLSKALNEMADSFPYFLNSCLVNSFPTNEAWVSVFPAQSLGSVITQVHRSIRKRKPEKYYVNYQIECSFSHFICEYIYSMYTLKEPLNSLIFFLYISLLCVFFLSIFSLFCPCPFV